MEAAKLSFEEDSIPPVVSESRSRFGSVGVGDGMRGDWNGSAKGDPGSRPSCRFCTFRRYRGPTVMTRKVGMVA